MSEDLPDYSNYSVLKAQDEDKNWLTVLLDDKGRMIAVMKGDYAGELKTLAVDTKGRIQAVLTDPEDVFGNPSYMGAAELAARLGSVDIFDRRGEVVFLDNFDSPTLKWETGGTVTNLEVVRSIESALHGDYSVKLTTGDETLDTARIKKYHYLPVLKRIGMEYSFALGSGLAAVISSFGFYTKTTYYTPNVWYDVTYDKLSLEDAIEGTVDIATGIVLRENDQTYHTWKVVVDLDTEKYVRILLNDEEHDVSDYSLPKTTGSYTPHMFLYIYAINKTAGNHYIYVDNAIFTQNEP